MHHTNISLSSQHLYVLSKNYHLHFINWEEKYNESKGQIQQKHLGALERNLGAIQAPKSM